MKKRHTRIRKLPRQNIAHLFILIFLFLILPILFWGVQNTQKLLSHAAGPQSKLGVFAVWAQAPSNPTSMPTPDELPYDAFPEPDNIESSTPTPQPSKASVVDINRTIIYVVNFFRTLIPALIRFTQTVLP